MPNPNKILIYGDPHLSSKHYGSHIDYPKESLELFKNILTVAKQYDCGKLISLGDFTYGRFHNLDYMLQVENELLAQREWTNDNHYTLKGNHDVSTQGMTPWEFYVAKGWMKNVSYIDLPSARVHLVNYGEEGRPLDIATDKENIVLGHNYYRYSNTIFNRSYGGGGVVLDNVASWNKVNLIISGHIHDRQQCSGCVITGTLAHEIPVIYPGCPTRPALQEGLDEQGCYVILDCSGDTTQMVLHEFDLPPLNEIFLVKQKKVVKTPLIDVSDIIHSLQEHKLLSQDPQIVIDTLTNFTKESREKAKIWLRDA